MSRNLKKTILTSEQRIKNLKVFEQKYEDLESEIRLLKLQLKSKEEENKIVVRDTVIKEKKKKFGIFQIRNLEICPIYFSLMTVSHIDTRNNKFCQNSSNFVKSVWRHLKLKLFYWISGWIRQFLKSLEMGSPPFGNFQTFFF